MIPNLDEIEVERINKGADADKKAAKRMVNVDMNPMVDLAFLLLTFFMLATTFSKPQAMELLVPAKPKQEDVEKETPVKESKTLSIVLAKNRIVWYQGISDPDTHAISYDGTDLETFLGKINGEVDGLVVLIKPLQESNYGNLVKAFDALNYSGVQRYAISELSEFDKTMDKSKTSQSDE